MITSCFQPKSWKQPVKWAFTLFRAGERATSPDRYVRTTLSIISSAPVFGEDSGRLQLRHTVGVE